MQNVFDNILISFLLGILWSGVRGSQSGFGGLGVLNASYGAPVDRGHRGDHGCESDRDVSRWLLQEALIRGGG